MDFKTLRDLAIGKAIGPTQVERAADVSEAFVGALVNEALHKIERLALWKFSEATVTVPLTPGDTSATPPADLALPLMARNEETGRELQFHDDRQAFKNQPDRRGHVETYSVFAGSLNFYPAASKDTDVTLRYYTLWSDMVADGDEPDPLPEAWHSILSDYAAAKLTLRLPPIGGRYLPASAAEPFEQAWQSGLQALLESPLVLPTADIIPHHRIEESMYLGEGADW